LLVVIVPVLVAVILLTAVGSEAHSARFGGEAEDERFESDRFMRDPSAERPARLRN
jgi:hypothetical protein